MNIRIFGEDVRANQHTATASPPYSQKEFGAANMYTAILDTIAALIAILDGATSIVDSVIVVIPAVLL